MIDDLVKAAIIDRVRTSMALTQKVEVVTVGEKSGLAGNSITPAGYVAPTSPAASARDKESLVAVELESFTAAGPEADVETPVWGAGYNWESSVNVAVFAASMAQRTALILEIGRVTGELPEGIDRIEAAAWGLSVDTDSTQVLSFQALLTFTAFTAGHPLT